MSRIQVKAKFERMVCKGKDTRLEFTLDPDYRGYAGQLVDMTSLNCLIRIESEQMDMDEMLAEDLASEDQMEIEDAIEEANAELDSAGEGASDEDNQ